MKKYILLLFISLVLAIPSIVSANALSDRQIKTSEEIAKENAHIKDALSPAPEYKDTISEEISPQIKEEKKEEIIYTTRTTPISINHEGNDDLGRRFALSLKNELNQSSLFNLEDSMSKPKITLMISTTSEFKDRPAMGSAYALVWVFVHDNTTLKYYLDQEVGVFTADEIDGLVARIIDRADGFAVLYNYLF